MAGTSFSVLISRPAEDIFDLVADVRRNQEWSPGFSGAEKTTGGAVGLGTSFRTTSKGIGDIEIRIDDYVRPVRLAFVGTGRLATIHHRFAFHPEARDTWVEQRIDVQPAGMLRPLSPLMAAMLRRTILRNTADLKQYLEQVRSEDEKSDVAAVQATPSEGDRV